MHLQTRSSRAFALASSGALVAGLALLPAGPASAAPQVSEYIGQASSSADSSCTATGSTFVSSGPKMLHHGHAKGGVNLAASWTSGTNTSDITTVSGHYSGSAHVVKKGAAFSTASVTGSGHLNITRALGKSSTCDASVQLLNAVEVISKQPAGWYYVTRNTTKSSLTETIVIPGVGLGTTPPVIFEAYQGGANTVTQRAFVPKGTYLTALISGLEGGDFKILTASSKNGSTVTRGSKTNTMSAVFRNAGSALKGAKGSATHFVKFPATVSCSHHSATLTWSGSASKVASSAFYVNGKKKASVSNPNAGHRVVLSHLGATADNTITAKLSLTGGGTATAKALYVPCHD
jgi:hypothetical protein